MYRQLGALISAPILLCGPMLAPGAPAWADPTDAAAGSSLEQNADVTGSDISQVAAQPGNSSGDACQQFGAALDLAASQYEDFAYATAGNGDVVNYQNPEVLSSNVLGRTALREAAGSALSASRSPGLPPEISEPMQSWSLHATKLLLIMGLHGGGDSLNSTANQLNTDAQNAQMACAGAGGHA